jgi:nitrous oxide reductase accessory protein NosL
MKQVLCCLVLVAACVAGCGKKDSDKAGAPGATGDTSDCGTYASLVVKCANGAGDQGILEKTCKATIEKNNVMTESMKAQVACAKANTDCTAYAKCVAGIH